MSAPRTPFWASVLWLLSLAACSQPGQAAVESLEGGAAAPLELRLASLTGARDGGLLRAQIRFEGEAGWLAMELEFELGVPTRLSRGSYEGEISGHRRQGGVASRSVTFLGGQSDRPNLGGVFTLLSGDGSQRYRVRLPTSVVQRRDPIGR